MNLRLKVICLIIKNILNLVVIFKMNLNKNQKLLNRNKMNKNLRNSNKEKRREN